MNTDFADDNEKYTVTLAQLRERLLDVLEWNDLKTNDDIAQAVLALALGEIEV